MDTKDLKEGEIYFCSTSYIFMCAQDGTKRYKYRIGNGKFAKNSDHTNTVQRIATEEEKEWFLWVVGMCLNDGQFAPSLSEYLKRTALNYSIY